MKQEPKITALRIKHDVMSYFRFNRQCICASECMNNDVMIITKSDLVLEVEVKISKYDLWKGEAKKKKHKWILNPSIHNNWIPNRFYMCVPISLEEEAHKWVEKINPKYGIIRYQPKYYSSITIAKSAKLLHNEKYDSLKQSIMMRVCSENIGLIGRLLK